MYQMKIEGYCIYNPKTGLYSKGGYSAEWKKKPKIWANIGHLKNHLHMFVYNEYYPEKKICIRTNYKDCVVYDLVTQEPHSLDIMEFLTDIAEKEQKRYPQYQIVYK